MVDLHIGREKCTVLPFTASVLTHLPDFDCNEKEQNDFIREFAVGHYLAGVNHTFVLLCGDELVGFASFSNATIETSEEIVRQIKSLVEYYIINNNLHLPPTANLKVELPFRRPPFILLGQLGIHKNYQRKGIGQELMKKFVIPYSEAYCIENSCIGILVHTTTAKNFYLKLGFAEIYSEGGFSTLVYTFYNKILEARYKRFIQH